MSIDFNHTPVNIQKTITLNNIDEPDPTAQTQLLHLNTHLKDLNQSSPATFKPPNQSVFKLFSDGCMPDKATPLG